MNALNRDIKYMERVVIKAERMSPKYQTLNKRIFVVEGGYGMFADTTGRRIFGYLAHDEQPLDILGSEIDAGETEALQFEEGDQ